MVALVRLDTAGNVVRFVQKVSTDALVMKPFVADTATIAVSHEYHMFALQRQFFEYQLIQCKFTKKSSKCIPLTIIA